MIKEETLGKLQDQWEEYHSDFYRELGNYKRWVDSVGEYSSVLFYDLDEVMHEVDSFILLIFRTFTSKYKEIHRKEPAPVLLRVETHINRCETVKDLWKDVKATLECLYIYARKQPDGKKHVSNIRRIVRDITALIKRICEAYLQVIEEVAGHSKGWSY